MKLLSLAVPAVAVLALLSPALPAASTADAAPREGSPDPSADATTVVRGELPDGATVTAHARTNRPLRVGDEIATVELPVVVDQASSRFEVKADARALPDAYFASGGVIDVQVVATADGGLLWADHITARAVRTDSGVRWTSTLAPTTDARPFGRLTSDRYGSDGVDVGPLADLGRAPEVSSRVGEYCSNEVLNSQWVKAQIGATYPVGRSTGWLDVNHSDGGRYQAAMKVPHHPMEKVEMMHADGGWGLTTPAKRGGKRYITTVKYLVIDNKHRAPDGTCQYYLTYEPTKESGGMRIRDGRRPRLWNCSDVPNGSTWRRYVPDGNPYRLSTGVSAGGMVGFELGLEKQYGESSHTLMYRVRGRKEMCGSNARPSTASIVMEKRRD